jgi:hypothetical protein
MANIREFGRIGPPDQVAFAIIGSHEDERDVPRNIDECRFLDVIFEWLKMRRVCRDKTFDR